MSKLRGTEGVIPMPPLSMAGAEAIGETLLELLSPETLEAPSRLDVAFLVDDLLPRRHRIHVSPASAAELDGNEGLTDPAGTADIEILMDQTQYLRLDDAGPRGFRPRATAMHEVGHAVLHVPVIRRRRESVASELLLQRVGRGELAAFRDPEWQAWAVAGAMLMPRRTLTKLRDKSAANVSLVYGVSEQFATAHLRRLKLS